jgi:hypothetical protein
MLKAAKPAFKIRMVVVGIRTALGFRTANSVCLRRFGKLRLPGCAGFWGCGWLWQGVRMALGLEEQTPFACGALASSGYRASLVLGMQEVVVLIEVVVELSFLSTNYTN